MGDQHLLRVSLGLEGPNKRRLGWPQQQYSDGDLRCALLLSLHTTLPAGTALHRLLCVPILSQAHHLLLKAVALLKGLGQGSALCGC